MTEIVAEQPVEKPANFVNLLGFYIIQGREATVGFELWEATNSQGQPIAALDDFTVYEKTRPFIAQGQRGRLELSLEGFPNKDKVLSTITAFADAMPPYK